VRPGEAIAQIPPSNAPLVKARVESQILTMKKSPDAGFCLSLSGPRHSKALSEQLRQAPAIGKQRGGSIRRTPSYEVIIQPQTRFVGNEDRQCRLQSGMEGRADIISRQETVLKFILRRTNGSVIQSTICFMSYK